MPWIPIYLDKEDLKFIINLLNDDSEIAFIVNNGFNKRNKWIAKDKIDDYGLNSYCLWHIPSGPLPLLTEESDNIEFILNPFDGWEEKRTGDDSTSPYFGPGHVGIIQFNNKTNIDNNKIGLSSFEWIGNHYRIIGFPANISTEIWWKKFRKQVSKFSTKIGRKDEFKPEIFCFSGALRKIKDGMHRSENP
ncbi:hypothetical protein [Leptospira paudalimensis]|uniref:Uncharacterized protein n=1 Tax=Leptospira paudalimensis TaxID=2950024 RepID=A0ABT3M5X1_9LEPT|nr:hypothetical protein [Leptospira paudalimensis]MCW7503569.1 hypothetical protein [Leptospira paudalimensis]